MEKLRIAIHYGADAIYLGGKQFGLRNLADNFSTADLAEAIRYARICGSCELLRWCVFQAMPISVPN